MWLFFLIAIYYIFASYLHTRLHCLIVATPTHLHGVFSGTLRIQLLPASVLSFCLAYYYTWNPVLQWFHEFLSLDAPAAVFAKYPQIARQSSKKIFRIKKRHATACRNLCAYLLIKVFWSVVCNKNCNTKQKSVQRKSPDAFISLRFRDRTPRKRLHITNALLYHWATAAHGAKYIIIGNLYYVKRQHCHKYCSFKI